VKSSEGAGKELSFLEPLCKKSAVNRAVHSFTCGQKNQTQIIELTMNDNEGAALVGAGIGIAMLLVFLCIALGLYIFFCFCYKRICEKCGVTPGVLVWIPIVQLIPLLKAARMEVWMILLFLIPLVNFIIWIMMWLKICAARGKSGLLVIGVVLLPIVFIPYLAFAD
jgi:hypothetical protein